MEHRSSLLSVVDDGSHGAGGAAGAREFWEGETFEGCMTPELRVLWLVSRLRFHTLRFMCRGNLAVCYMHI